MIGYYLKTTSITIALLISISACEETPNADQVNNQDVTPSEVEESPPATEVNTVTLAGYLPLASSDHQQIHHKYFSLAYSEAHEQPTWVAYTITHKQSNNDRVSRKSNFTLDHAVTTRSAEEADYDASGYDKGHIVPADNMRFNQTAQNECFFMSNVCPQDPSFNRGKWKALENQVRTWVDKEKVLIVVAGPVLEDGLPTIGENEVAIPNHFYKIIFDHREPEVKVLAFLMPNEKCDGELVSYAVSVDSIETLTGIDFFPQLENVLEESLESSIEVDEWFEVL